MSAPLTLRTLAPPVTGPRELPSLRAFLAHQWAHTGQFRQTPYESYPHLAGNARVGLVLHSLADWELRTLTEAALWYVDGDLCPVVESTAIAVPGGAALLPVESYGGPARPGGDRPPPPLLAPLLASARMGHSKQVNVRLPGPLADRLRAEADARGVNTGAIVASALTEHFDRDLAETAQAIHDRPPDATPSRTSTVTAERTAAGREAHAMPGDDLVGVTIVVPVPLRTCSGRFGKRMSKITRGWHE